MKSEKRWYWMIETSKFDNLSPHHTLDVLRYDGAKVESNAPPGFYLFSCDDRYHPKGPSVGRLNSHGVHVEVVFASPMTRDVASSKVWEWFGERLHAKVTAPASVQP